MASQKDVKNRIGSVKNIQKITRAMEMVAAARLRRAEQRIEALRPYAKAIRRMTRRTVEAVGDGAVHHPLMEDRENPAKVGLLLITGDRGLAGGFNSNIIRAGRRRADEIESEGKEVVWFASGKRGIASLNFRGLDVVVGYEGYTDRPAYANARDLADDVCALYIDGKIDAVEVIYNEYISPVTQEVRTDTLLPLQDMARLLEESLGEVDHEDDSDEASGGKVAPWIYEPDPEEILQRLVPDFIEVTIYRALLESTASEHGARMSAMRNAQENAGEVIENLTLEMNRQRQAEITQEIMEVVAGAEGLS